MSTRPLRHSCGFAWQQYVSINWHFLKHDASSRAALLMALVTCLNQRPGNPGACAVQQRIDLDLVLEIAQGAACDSWSWTRLQLGTLAFLSDHDTGGVASERNLASPQFARLVATIVSI